MEYNINVINNLSVQKSFSALMALTTSILILAMFTLSSPASAKGPARPPVIKPPKPAPAKPTVTPKVNTPIKMKTTTPKPVNKPGSITPKINKPVKVNKPMAKPGVVVKNPAVKPGTVIKKPGTKPAAKPGAKPAVKPGGIVKNPTNAKVTKKDVRDGKKGILTREFNPKANPKPVIKDKFNKASGAGKGGNGKKKKTDKPEPKPKPKKSLFDGINLK